MKRPNPIMYYDTVNETLNTSVLLEWQAAEVAPKLPNHIYFFPEGEEEPVSQTVVARYSEILSSVVLTRHSEETAAEVATKHPETNFFLLKVEPG